MIHPADELRTVVLEREFPHPPEKLWRALTEESLLAQWLLRNDFKAVVGQSFRFQADPVPNWDGVIQCKVLLVEPLKQLSYTWNSMGLESVVLFTLTPTVIGTHLRMEHSGFHAQQEAAYRGATYGWQKFLGQLDHTLQGDLS